MDNVLALKNVITAQPDQLNILSVLFNFIVCVIMAFVLRKFYVERSFSLTGKTHIGSILPILSAVVFLVIMVVKSSLALSLGLVGALSIVRFRTPIKEPEELVYLFMAIALGLGYGAGYTLLTTVIVSLILMMVYLWLSNRDVAVTNEYNLVINWFSEQVTFSTLSEQIGKYSDSLKLVRLDSAPEHNTAVFLLVPNNETNIDTIINNLRGHDPDLKMTFYEAKTNW